jgi:uncharacterized membrane protein YeaQ/YmgE (transglycosylase-associated protein family)
MSFIAWIVLGLISGLVASLIVNKRGAGVILDVLLGIGGALVGGVLFDAFGSVGVTGLNLWSMFVSVVGASLLIVGYHAIMGRRALA